MSAHHLHDSSDDWTTYENTFVHPKSSIPKRSNMGLVFLLAILMAMMFYIGSFYLDNKPLPEEVNQEEKPSETNFNFPATPGFEKNFG